MPHRCLGFGLAVLLAVMMTRAEHAEPLGESGDPHRLLIRGAAVIPTQDVRRAVARNWQLHLASLPAADRDTYLSQLQRLLVRGYHQAGFPDAHALAYHDAEADAITLRITEGPRLITGPVRIIGTGADDLDTDALIARLTQPQPRRPFFAQIDAVGIIRIQRTPTNELQNGLDALGPAQHPALWPEGQPAVADPSKLASIRSAVKVALAEQDYLNATVQITTPRTDDGRAVLQLQLADLGPRAKLGVVQVKGVDEATAAQARVLLGINPGDPLDLHALLTFQEKLWASGRFVRHEVVGIVADAATGQVVLNVDLLPQAHVPPLGGETTETQEAALRLAAWLNANIFTQPLDIVFEDASLHARLMTHPTRGMMIDLRPVPAPHAPPDPAAAPDPGDPSLLANLGLRPHGPLTVFAQANEITLIDHATQKRWVTRFDLARLIAVISIVGNPEDPEANGTISFGAGVHQASHGEPHTPLTISGRVDPVAILSHLSDPDNRVSLEDGLLIVRGEQSELRCEANSGRLIEWRWGGSGMSVGVRPARDDDWAHALDQAEGAVTETHAFPPQQAILGLARVATDLYLNIRRETHPEHAERYAAATGAIYRLLEGSLTDLFVEGFTDALPHDDRFTIPSDPELMARLGMMSMVVALLPYADDAFARGSWPWTITHATALLTVGMGRLGQAELIRLYHDGEAGPLAMLAAARLLDAVGERQMAAQFARQGRERLTHEHLANDLRPLIVGDATAPATARRLLASLRTLEPAESEALAVLAEQATGYAAAAWSRAWAHAPTDPLPTDDPRALAERWLPLLRAHLGVEFEALSRGPKTAPAAPR